MSEENRSDVNHEGIPWEEIYRSDLMKSLKRKRMLFVIPSVILVSLAFAILWTIQSYFPSIANMQVIGYVNFAFLYTMLLFPIIWFAGYMYTRYATKVLEPIEKQIIDKYEVKESDNG